MDRVIIDRMVVHGIVGAKERERVKPQALHLTLTLFTDFSKAAISDDLPNAIDYSIISRSVYDFVTKKKAKLLEHLACAVAEFLFSHDARIRKVEVLIQKPSAIALASFASVFITRVRADFPELASVVKTTASPNALPTELTVPTENPQEAVYIGIGTNLGNRAANIRIALTKLAQFCVIERVSFLYETRPKYVTNQPRFMNCAVKLTTKLEPSELLRSLKTIEEEMGRNFSTVRNGPRIIDLDILFYGTRRILLSTLVVPHPQLHERDFVVGPLMDIAPPNLVYSEEKTLQKLWLELNQCSDIFPVCPCTVNSEEISLNFHHQSKTLIMGILNITPDSFSDGGKFLPRENSSENSSSAGSSSEIPSSAGNSSEIGEKSSRDMSEILTVVKSWVSQKIVDIVDIGGESTRPGATPVSEDEEKNRVIPVIKALRSQDWFGTTIISVDTYKSSVAEAAILAGANIINDITAGSDTNMFKVAAKYSVPIVLMHTRGTPQEMMSNANYENGKEIEIVAKELNERVKKALEEGILPWNIIVDPGIGFAKKIQHNLNLLRDLKKLPKLIGKFPILIGTSRKRFIGTVTHQSTPKERAWGTAATMAAAIEAGANIIRVHDVPEMAQVAMMSDAIWRKIGYTDE